MSKDRKNTDVLGKDWPEVLAENENLFSVTNLDIDETEYLVLDSATYGGLFIREKGRWVRVENGERFFVMIDDPKYLQFDEDIEFIKEFDEMEKKKLEKAEKSITSAASNEETSEPCPPATLDTALNLKNRKRAIQVADYGPMNPNEENADFWDLKAKSWSVSIEDAKKSICGNCVFFVTTTKIKDCIAQGIESGGSGSTSAWDAIDQADLGYCEAFDFKCAAKRTCNAWVVGGPITDDVELSRGI